MDFKSLCEGNPSNVECSFDLKTDNDSIRVPDGEVSEKFMKQKKFDGENSKKHTKNRKFSRKRKISDHQSISGKEVKKAPKKQSSAAAAAVPNDVDCPTSHTAYEDTTEIPEDEVSNQLKATNNTTDSDRKNIKNPVKEGKLSRKRKKPYHLPTLETDDKETSGKKNQASVVDFPNANIRTHENTDTSNIRTDENTNTSNIRTDENTNTSNIKTDENTNENISDGVIKKLKTTSKPTRSRGKSSNKLSKDRKHLNSKQKPDILSMLQMEKTSKVMTKQNDATVESGESIVQCSTSQTDDHIENQSSKVLYEKKTTEDPDCLNEKNTKKPAEEKISKIPLKRKRQNELPELQTEGKDNKDKVNENVNFVKTGPVDNTPNLRTKENNKRIYVEDFSNSTKKIKKSENSNKKSSNVTTKHGKLSLKMKTTCYPPTSQMVMEAIKVLKKRNGASVNAILEYMQGKYRVNTKLIKRYVTRYMNSAVQKGLLDKIGRTGDNGKFKTKKAEKIAKNGRNITKRKPKIGRNNK